MQHDFFAGDSRWGDGRVAAPAASLGPAAAQPVPRGTAYICFIKVFLYVYRFTMAL
jgi:hypothetical protein